jgi:hypothetical protein
MKSDWTLCDTVDGPNGEEIFVYRLPTGEYTYCVVGSTTVGGTYRTRSWLDAASHYHRTTTSWDEDTDPNGFARLVCDDEQSTVRPAVAL